MSTPISESTHRSRARRDYASGRIDFDRITRRGGWLSRRHLPPPTGLRAVNAIFDFVDPGDARIALRCWSCHADIFEIEPR
jgi:hypothetical protein